MKEVFLKKGKICQKSSHDLYPSTNLNCGHVSFQPDDLSDQLVVTDPDQLVHGGARHVLGGDDGARDPKDVAENMLLVLVTHFWQVGHVGGFLVLSETGQTSSNPQGYTDPQSLTGFHSSKKVKVLISRITCGLRIKPDLTKYHRLGLKENIKQDFLAL